MDTVVERAAPTTIDTVAPADERALRDWFAVLMAAQAHDVPADPPPCWVEHRARLVATDPGYAETAWLARDGDGEPAGVAVLALPTLDNPEVALAELVVAPRYRRGDLQRRLRPVDGVDQRGDGLPAPRPPSRVGAGPLSRLSAPATGR